MVHMKIIAAALSVMTLLPMGAGASTVTPASNIANGGTYDMLGGAYFYGETFTAPDGAGVRNFTFTNGNTVSENLILTTATVNALAAKFTGGIKFEWLTSHVMLSVAESVSNFSGTLDNLIAANSSDTLRITFGDPANRRTRNGFANFTVSLDAEPVAPVPLPAGGLLLLGALGGLAALRRRKSV